MNNIHLSTSGVKNVKPLGKNNHPKAGTIAIFAAIFLCHPTHAQSEKTMPSMTKANETLFYARANLYSIPIRPELPLSALEAETSKTHYRFGMEGTHIHWAEKWVTDRRPVALETEWISKLDKGVHYFVPATDGHPPEPKSLMTVLNQKTYIRVEIFLDERAPVIEQVSQERTLRHEYDYWKNGALKHWHFETDNSQGDDYFNEAGHPLK